MKEKISNLFKSFLELKEELPSLIFSLQTPALMATIIVFVLCFFVEIVSFFLNWFPLTLMISSIATLTYFIWRFGDE